MELQVKYRIIYIIMEPIIILHNANKLFLFFKNLKDGIKITATNTISTIRVAIAAPNTSYFFINKIFYIILHIAADI